MDNLSRLIKKCVESDLPVTDIDVLVENYEREKAEIEESTRREIEEIRNGEWYKCQ